VVIVVVLDPPGDQSEDCGGVWQWRDMDVDLLS
jgi:hypothetical protein